MTLNESRFRRDTWLHTAPENFFKGVCLGDNLIRLSTPQQKRLWMLRGLIKEAGQQRIAVIHLCNEKQNAAPFRARAQWNMLRSGLVKDGRCKKVAITQRSCIEKGIKRTWWSILTRWDSQVKGRNGGLAHTHALDAVSACSQDQP